MLLLPLQAFANGGKRAPECGALLIWQEGGEFKHHLVNVAIITEVLMDRVRIAEQKCNSFPSTKRSTMDP